MAPKTLSEKENLLRVYRHEKPEYLPNHGKATHTIEEYSAFHERPGPGDDIDSFGVKYYLHPSYGGVPAHDVPHVITDITRWREQVTFPDLDAVDWESASRVDGVENIDRENKVVKAQLQCGPWERTHSLMGMDNAYIALATEPEAMEDLFNAIEEYKFKQYSYMIKYYKPDVIRQHDDYGTNTSMQMSPDMWRQFIKPHTARLVKLCHDNGVFYEQHSCGLIEPIIPDFVEIGIDSWNGMHINDVPKLQKMAEGKLVFNMSLNTPEYLVLDSVGKLTEEWLRNDVRETLMTCGAQGNYFPVYNAPGDPNWWGLAVITDEVKKARDTLTF